MGEEQKEKKKHPCPDCFHCNWCSNERCELCRGWLVKPYVDPDAKASAGENKCVCGKYDGSCRCSRPEEGKEGK